MPAGGTQTDPTRLDSLTSLRFFAAAIVLLHHAFAILMPGTLGATLTSAGYVGVGFFFVLSGFVLAWTFKPSLPTRNFYGRRLARIYPLHVGTAIVAAAMILAIGGSLPIWPSTLNVLLLQSWVPVESYGASLNGVSWSLCCEAFFYLCFPVLIRWAQRWNLRVAATVVVVAMLAVAAASVILLPQEVAQQFLYKSPLFRIGEFILGILLAVGMQRGYRLNVGIGPALLLVALSYGASLAIGPAVRALGLPDLRAFADLLVIPATCLLIHAAANSDLRGAGKWLRSRWLVVLGDASFALYMIHYLLLIGWEEVLGRPTSTMLGYASVAAASALAVGLSLVVYRWYEHPLERVLRRRLGTPTAAATPHSIQRNSIAADPS